MRLAIIGDTRHARDASGCLYTWSPLVRQLKPWIERFDQVVVCGILIPGPPPVTFEPYPAPYVQLCELPAGGGNTLGAKLGLIRRVAQWWPVLRRTLREADVVHFRCPCNIAVVGLAALRGLCPSRFAMYAGGWRGYPGESPFYRLQRRWLNSPRFGGTVAVYGHWPGQPSHVVSSFSPSFTLSEWLAHARRVQDKIDGYTGLDRLDCLRIVSVGRLLAEKNQACILRALALLRDWSVNASLDCLGDGADRSRLSVLARELRIDTRVRLRGWVSLEEVRQAHQDAHIGVLASLSEGFPKAVVESMEGGAVPVVSDVGINSELLGYGERGVVFPFDDHTRLAQHLADLGRDPRRLARMARAGREYTRTTTLDAFVDLQRRILDNILGVPEKPRRREEIPT